MAGKQSPSIPTSAARHSAKISPFAGLGPACGPASGKERKNGEKEKEEKGAAAGRIRLSVPEPHPASSHIHNIDTMAAAATSP